MISEIQIQILPNEDIFKGCEEALITSGREVKSIILKCHPKDRYMNNCNLNGFLHEMTMWAFKCV